MNHCHVMDSMNKRHVTQSNTKSIGVRKKHVRSKIIVEQKILERKFFFFNTKIPSRHAPPALRPLPGG